MSKNRIRVHYKTTSHADTVLCGKQAADVESTSDANAVTCHNCQRSLKRLAKRSQRDTPGEEHSPL